MVTEVRTRRIDADTHFNLTIDRADLRALLPRQQMAQAGSLTPAASAPRCARPAPARASPAARLATRSSTPRLG